MNRRPKLLIIINIILLAHNVLCNPIENKDATTTIMPSTSHLSDAVNVSNYAPWVLSLSRGRKILETGQEHKCGAVLLNGQWALTTKFCADQNLDNELNLGSGFSLKDIQKSGRIPIVQVIEYMKSSDANKTHDIVLLQLHRPMNVETNELKPPCIASKAIPKSGLVVLYGWGSKYPSEIQTEKIGHSSLHYWMHYHNSDKQKKMIASIVSPPANVSNEPENLFWIQAKDSEQVPCQGDFGGPVHQIENGHLQISGLFSGCEFGGNNYHKYWNCQGPVSAIRLSYYRDWIEKHVGNVFCD